MTTFFDLIGRTILVVKTTEIGPLTIIRLSFIDKSIYIRFERQDVTIRGAYHLLLDKPISFIGVSIANDSDSNVYCYKITNSNGAFEMHSVTKLEIEEEDEFIRNPVQNEF